VEVAPINQKIKKLKADTKTKKKTTWAELLAATKQT